MTNLSLFTCTHVTPARLIVLLWNKKEKIFRNRGDINVHCVVKNTGTFFPNISFRVLQKKVMQVWNDMRVNDDTIVI